MCLLVVALWTLRLIGGGDMGSSAALRLPSGDDGDMVTVSSVFLTWKSQLMSRMAVVPELKIALGSSRAAWGKTKLTRSHVRST